MDSLILLPQVLKVAAGSYYDNDRPFPCILWSRLTGCFWWRVSESLLRFYSPDDHGEVATSRKTLMDFCTDEIKHQVIAFEKRNVCWYRCLNKYVWIHKELSRRAHGPGKCCASWYSAQYFTLHASDSIFKGPWELVSRTYRECWVSEWVKIHWHADMVRR